MFVINFLFISLREHVKKIAFFVKWHKKSSPEKKNHIERNWKLEEKKNLSYQDNTRDELPYIEKRKEKRKGKRKRK